MDKSDRFFDIGDPVLFARRHSAGAAVRAISGKLDRRLKTISRKYKQQTAPFGDVVKAAEAIRTWHIDAGAADTIGEQEELIRQKKAELKLK